MPERSITMLVLCAVAAMVNGAAGWWSFRRRHQVPPASAFALLCFNYTAWHLGHFAETWAQSLEAKLFWDSLQNVPFLLAAPCTVRVALDYLRIRGSRRVSIALGFATAVIAVPLATEPLHHLLRQGATLVGSPAVLTYPFSLLDLAAALTIYAAAIAAFVLLMRGLGDLPQGYALQRLVLALALASPVIATPVVMALQLRVDGDRDVTPLTTTLGALLAMWGLARHGLFELTLIARDTVIASLQEGVIVVDRTNHIVDMNRAGALITRGAIGMSTDELFKDWPSARALLTEGSTRTADIGTDPHDPAHFYEAACTALREQGGKSVGSALVLRDVTSQRQRVERLSHRVTARTQELHEVQVSLERESAERHHAETALALSEERLRALFDQVFQLTGILDRDGRVLTCNRASLEMIDKRESDVVGRFFWETPWWSHSHEEQQVLRGAIARCSLGEFVRLQTHHRDAEGKIRHIDFSLTPVRDANGDVVEMIPEGRDITSLHEERERAAALEAELERAHRLESMGRLAGGLAHDFNNLLTVIGCSAELAAAEVPDNSPVADCLDSIKEAASTASNITRGLLTFGRQQPLQPRRASLHEVVETTERLLRRLLRENVHLEIDVPQHLWEVHADVVQLQQALMNLMLNAQDAMPNGGVLRVSARNVRLEDNAARAIAGARAGEFTCLEVTDGGMGMTPETRARAFEPFFSTKERGKGSGLGLAIVHGVITQSGGFAELHSELGKGTTFKLYFPRAGKSIIEAGRAPSAVLASSGPATVRAQIFVVEDQAPVSRMMKRVLENGGHEVRTFSNAADALAAVERGERAPDLLITDVVMPGMSGLDLADAMTKGRPKLRVLIMSGYAETRQLDVISKMPPNTFLAKPFRTAALLDKVQAILRAPPVSLAARLHEADAPHAR